MTTTTITTNPTIPSPQQFPQFPMFPNNPNDEIARLRNEIADLKRQINDNNSSKLSDIEARLANTPKGQMYINLKRDGIVDILMQQAIANPMTSDQVNKFLANWQKDVEEYLKTV